MSDKITPASRHIGILSFTIDIRKAPFVAFCPELQISGEGETIPQAVAKCAGAALIEARKVNGESPVS